jgi:hypothetical protein
MTIIEFSSAYGTGTVVPVSGTWANLPSGTYADYHVKLFSWDVGDNVYYQQWFEDSTYPLLPDGTWTTPAEEGMRGGVKIARLYRTSDNALIAVNTLNRYSLSTAPTIPITLTATSAMPIHAVTSLSLPLSLSAAAGMALHSSSSSSFGMVLSMADTVRSRSHLYATWDADLALAANAYYRQSYHLSAAIEMPASIDNTRVHTTIPPIVLPTPPPIAAQADPVTHGFVTPDPLPQVYAFLYDSTGYNLIAWCENARGIKFRRELSKAGSASFEIPLDATYAKFMTENRIVKFTVGGVVQFGCVLRTAHCELAADGTRWLQFNDQPGIASILGRAITYPNLFGARPLKACSTDARAFGFMSPGTYAFEPDWGTPQGVAFRNVTDYRKGFPVEFKAGDPSAAWIAKTGPTQSVPEGRINYFRFPGGVYSSIWRSKYADEGVITIKVYAAGDNTFVLYLDGVEILRSPQTDNSWRKIVVSQDITLDQYGHVFAAKVENTAGGSSNPIGFIAAIVQVVDGKEAGVITNGHTSLDWAVKDNTTPTGWFRGNIANTLYNEGKDRGVDGFDSINVTFTDTTDSSGIAWNERVELSFDCGTPLYDVMVALSDTNFDWEFLAEEMELSAWNKLGSDKSTTITLDMLKSNSVDRTAGGATMGLYNKDTGVWAETPVLGPRRESMTTLGSTTDKVTAETIMATELAKTMIPITTVTVETSFASPQAFVDYNLGDIVSVRVLDDTYTPVTKKARVMAITMDNSDDVPRCWPELVVVPPVTASVDIPRALPPTHAQRLKTALAAVLPGNSAGSSPLATPVYDSPSYQAASGGGTGGGTHVFIQADTPVDAVESDLWVRLLP